MTDELTEQQRAWVADLRELASVFEANPSMIPTTSGAYLFLHPEMSGRDITTEHVIEALGGPLEMGETMGDQIVRRFGLHKVTVNVPPARRSEVSTVVTRYAPDPAIAAAVAAANA